MSSFVGLSSASRARLTAEASRLQGTLIVTLHKAHHLKNSAVFGDSDVYCTLNIGSQKFQSLVARAGNTHPTWSQQFLFTLKGGAGSDTSLHVRVYDEEAPVGGGGPPCIGTLDINFMQLLHASNSKEVDAQWIPLSSPTDFSVRAGFLCLTAVFDGTGLPSRAEEEASEAAEQKEREEAAEAAAEAAKKKQVDATLGEGEHNIPELSTANGADSTAAAAAAAPDANGAAAAQPPKSAFPPSSTTTLIPPPSSSTSAFLPTPTPAPIVLVLPTKISAETLPAPANPESQFYAQPEKRYPNPQPRPPAPGYPLLPPVSPLNGGATGTLSNRLVIPAENGTEAPAAETEDSPPPAEESKDSSSVIVSPRKGEREYEEGDLAPAQAPALLTAYDSRHPHILQLLEAVPSGRFQCRVCNGEGFHSAYHCTEGCEDYNIHEVCLDATTPPDAEEQVDMRIDPRHSHPLTWFESIYDNTYSCRGCGGGGVGPVWHCKTCSFDLHPACMK